MSKAKELIAPFTKKEGTKSKQEPVALVYGVPVPIVDFDKLVRGSKSLLRPYAEAAKAIAGANVIGALTRSFD